MKLRPSRLSAGLLALALALSLTLPAFAAESPDLAASAQAAAELTLQYSGATSIQYALWQDGELVLEGSAGVYSKTENRALTSDVLYGAGSVSKTFTAAAMMKLVEEGKVDLDAPVTTYLPDFTMADSRYQDITVRMLLNHAAGLMGNTSVNSYLWNDPQEDDAAEHFLDRLASQSLQADPGAYSVYSNDGFTLAQLVIEAVTGMDYSAYLREAVTGPLGLENTLTPADGLDESRTAKAYLGEDTRALPEEDLAIVAAGGIYSTASDLAAFGGALCSEGFLTQSSLDAMAGDEYLSGMWPENSEGDALAYGLGWDSVHVFPFNQSDIQALVKGGDTLVYHAGLLVIPEYDMAAAVLSSGGVSTYNQAMATRMLMDALVQEGVTVDSSFSLPEAQPAEMPQELTALSGTYASFLSLLTVDVTADGVLKLGVPGVEGAQEYIYYSDGTFRDTSNSLLLQLVTEDNGQVYLFQKTYTDLPGLVPLCTASYACERLPERTVSEEIQSAWNARDGHLYLLLNDKYTSSMYDMGGAFAAISLAGSPAGYAGSYVLTSEDTADAFLQIPGTGSRSLTPIRMMDGENGELLETNGTLYLDFTAAENIFPGAASYCTIQPDGYSRWYQVGEAAGNVMTVTLPEQGAFRVYDAAGQLAASSWALGDTSVTLPVGGWVVFSGDVGAQFFVTMERGTN